MAEHLRLPHLRPFAREPIVFLTIVTHDRRPLLACESMHSLLRGLWERSPAFDGWSVGRYVLMPDHVHLFARAAIDAKPLARWVQTWKSISARRFEPALNVAGPFWQKDYFDRFLRSADNYTEKWDYVRHNPVRKGLVSNVADWPWQGFIEDLSF